MLDKNCKFKSCRSVFMRNTLWDPPSYNFHESFKQSSNDQIVFKDPIRQAGSRNIKIRNKLPEQVLRPHKWIIKTSLGEDIILHYCVLVSAVSSSNRLIVAYLWEPFTRSSPFSLLLGTSLADEYRQVTATSLYKYTNFSNLHQR
jgi:hypothetical protein